MPLIISNYANDYIEYNNSIVKWWPAYYIEKYFISNNINYNFISWNDYWKVIISKKQWNDVWIIKYAPNIKIWKQKSDYFIISTLCNEFDLKDTYKLNWIIFCDIQWYIRELNSDKRLILNELDWLENVDFLKVSDYELNYLTKNLINNYIKSWWTILITTGEKWIIKIINKNWNNIINISTEIFNDTIWAWDTFLAAFADYFMQNKKLEESVVKASNYVIDFLRKKNLKFKI